MHYDLPEFPFPYDAFEPYLRAESLRSHHQRRHRHYVERLNASLADHPKLDPISLDRILGDIRRIVPEECRQTIRNVGGGHLNHSLFWHILSPDPKPEPTGRLRKAMDMTFGGFRLFREKVARTAHRRFGSGWVWLCMETDGSLNVLSTPNEDSPVMLAARPLLGIDLWEHAYWGSFADRRDKYVEAIWNVIDWAKVEALYHQGLEVTSRQHRRHRMRH